MSLNLSLCSSAEKITTRYKHKTPGIQELLLIKHSGGEELRVIQEAQGEWYDIGIELGLSPPELNNIQSICQGNKKQCCEMFTLWLQKGSEEYGTTWYGLVKVLQNVQLKPLAESVVYALNNKD